MSSSDSCNTHRCACGNLRRTTRAVTQFYDRFFQKCGLRSSQFSLLFTISLNENISVSELGDKLRMDQTTVTRNLKILGKNDYIRIARGKKDARKKAIFITEEGAKKLTEAIPLWENAQKRIEEEFGMERLENLITELNGLVELVE
jgi:DNA-binding MarR family transcriptional regulator